MKQLKSQDIKIVKGDSEVGGERAENVVGPL